MIGYVECNREIGQFANEQKFESGMQQLSLVYIIWKTAMKKCKSAFILLGRFDTVRGEQ